MITLLLCVSLVAFGSVMIAVSFGLKDGARARHPYKYPEPSTSHWGSIRDAVAWHIAGFALRRIATPWYRAMISGSIRLGLDAARQEAYDARSISTDRATEQG